MPGAAENPIPGNQDARTWKRLLAIVGIDYLALFVFLSVFMGLFMRYGGAIRATDGSVVWPSMVLVVIVVSRGIFQKARSTNETIRDSLEIIRDWLPIILLILVFENLRLLTGRIQPDSISAHLYSADVKLFGVEPTVWAERFANPWLTDYFAFSYALYFFFPLILGTTLYVRKKREDFREMILGVLSVMYVGFLLYLIFPAGPPRYLLAHLYDPPKLNGIFGLFEMVQGKFDSINPLLVHSSFPSLHCALSLTALLYTWRFRKALGGALMFWIFLPFVVSLWLSTIYLRHHWAVDCFAGFGLGAVMFGVTAWLRRRFEEFRDRVLLEE